MTEYNIFEPQNVDDLIESCLIELGKPVIEINVAPVQATLCAKKAIDMFCDYHYDSTEQVFMAQEVTQEDLENNYVETPKNVYEVIRVLGANRFPSVFGGSMGCYNGHGASPAIHDTYAGMRGNLGANDALITMYLANAHSSYFNSIIKPNVGMTWNKASRRIRPQGSLKQLTQNCSANFIVYEAHVLNEDLCFSCSNPSGNGSSFYGNQWLKSYTAALIKKQWAQNMSKFKNIPVLNGLDFNGDEIMATAKEEIETLEQQLFDRYTLPAQMIIG